MNPKYARPEDNPAVHIHGTGPSGSSTVESILLGLEEEGVPAEVFEAGQGPAARIAKKAADNSPLSVGIGVDDSQGVVVLHHRDLPEEKPLFILGPGVLAASPLRNLGANAARLVKGNPMINATDSDGKADAYSPIKLSQEQLEQLVREAVAIIVQER
ncbi:glycerol dehydratase reactivase beta/small subunit family protein [bacterium]|nr:glycerol dehydratase reactivase beta/small subunit family protein [bacterium]